MPIGIPIGVKGFVMGTFSPTVRIIASSSTWIEGEAVRQLETTARLPGIHLAVGLPDLHPGRGIPVGAAFVSENRIYPHLVGNDVGCGMGLWTTGLGRRDVKAEKAARRLAVLDEPLDNPEAVAALEREGLDALAGTSALGTVGGGNHFAELVSVDEVRDTKAFEVTALSTDELALLVHSGSRGYGDALLRAHTAVHGGAGLQADSDAAADYLRRHDLGVAWGRANRAAIARRFLAAIGGEGRRTLDVCHNSVTAAVADGCACWLHRKGAAPADKGPVIIPGSRGSLSYLVSPVGDQAANAWSLAHGAGRKWGRSDCKGRLEKRFRPEQLKRTALGSTVVCEDKALLYEEAPPAYKDIDRVVGDLVDAGLVAVIAVFRPVLTFKTARRSS